MEQMRREFDDWHDNRYGNSHNPINGIPVIEHCRIGLSAYQAALRSPAVVMLVEAAKEAKQYINDYICCYPEDLPHIGAWVALNDALEPFQEMGEPK